MQILEERFDFYEVKNAFAVVFASVGETQGDGFGFRAEMGDVVVDA